MKRNVRRHVVVQPLDPTIHLIPLTKGQNAIVDAADFERLNQWSWQALWNKDSRTFYAARSGCIYMHRLVLNAGEGAQVDHRDCDGLNNRRSNLRIATPAQNIANTRLRRCNTSGYKGVYWEARHHRWVARIRIDGTRLHLGEFKTVLEAADVYAKAAREHYGEFARV